MKKIKWILLLAVFLPFIIFNCKKKDDETDKPITTYMVATIDSVGWSSSNISQVRDANSIYISATGSGGYTVLGLYLPTINEIQASKSYKLTETGKFRMVYYYTPTLYLKSLTGNVEITEVNSTENMISGVFGFFTKDSIMDIDTTMIIDTSLTPDDTTYKYDTSYVVDTIIIEKGEFVSVMK